MVAKRSLGQHFLASDAVIRRILEACRAASGEAGGVLEIGPGRGALTEGLAALGKPLILCEKDDAFAPALATQFPAARVLHRDARGLDLAALGAEVGTGRWLVVGNLPYNVGTEIARRVLARPGLVAAALFMLQQEVVHKLVDGPDGKGYGPLGVWSQAAWEGRLLFEVPPGAFQPPPKVTSAVVRFLPKSRPLMGPDRLDDFDRFVRDAFVHPRRTLAGNLAATGWGERERVQEALAGWGHPTDARPAAVPSERFAELFLEFGKG